MKNFTISASIFGLATELASFVLLNFFKNFGLKAMSAFVLNNIIDREKIGYEDIDIGDVVSIVYTLRGKVGGKQFRCRGRVELKTENVIGVLGYRPIKREWIDRIYKINDGYKNSFIEEK